MKEREFKVKSVDLCENLDEQLSNILFLNEDKQVLKIIDSEM
jgi:hypothetical protein